METIQLDDKKFRLYITSEQLQAAIAEEVKKINEDFADTDEVPIFLCVLNGALPFTAEILKQVNFQCQLSSIKLTSYHGTQNTGTVLIPMGFNDDVKGRTVIICDDVIDSGNTIAALKALLESRGAKEVKTCCMLFKPEMYKKDDKIDYYAMAIRNEFIVGFGLDYNELGRQYKDIYIIEE